MKTAEMLDLNRRVNAVNIVLQRMQSGSNHPAFYHYQGLQGSLILDNAGMVWWNDPFDGLTPMRKAHETRYGTGAFKGFLRLMWFHLVQGTILLPDHFPSAADLGLSKADWDVALLAAQTHEVVIAQ